MTKGIYCYYDNLKCEIVYVGKDSHIDKNERHGQHYWPSKRKKQVINKVLQNDNKSGRYSYAVLEQGDFTDDELNQKEISWIAFFNPLHCYTEGGDGISLPGSKHPQFDPCIKIRKEKKKNYKQGYRWMAYPSTPSGVEHIYKVNLLECMKLVEEFLNSERNVYGYETYKVIGFIYGVDEINYKKDSSGANNPNFNPCIKIRKRKKKGYKQGFTWVAQPYTPEGQKCFSSFDLQKCIEKVEKFIDSERNISGYDSYEVIHN